MTARFLLPHFARFAALCLTIAVAVPAQAIPKAAEHAEAPVTYGADTARPTPVKAQKPPATKATAKSSSGKTTGTAAPGGKRTATRKSASGTGK